MYGIKSLPGGSHKGKAKYAYEDLDLSTYQKEVFTTLVRALSKDYEKSQKETQKEVSSVKKKILDIIEDCYPDMIKDIKFETLFANQWETHLLFLKS